MRSNTRVCGVCKWLSLAVLVFVAGVFTSSAYAQEQNQTQTDQEAKQETKNERLTKTEYAPSITASLRENPNPPSPPPSNNSWTGFYVGGFLGASIGRSSANTSTVFSPAGYFAASSVTAIAASGNQKLDPNGFTGGGQVGYNHQWGRLVLGVEADFGAMHLNQNASVTTTYPCCSTSSFTINQSIGTDWLFTVRPREGVTFGRTLLYITEGVAATRINYKETFTDTFASASESGSFNSTKAGWVVGAGGEFQINSHWSIKGEYLFTQFDRESITSTNLAANQTGPAFAQNVFTHSADLSAHNIRFGFNYRF